MFLVSCLIALTAFLIINGMHMKMEHEQLLVEFQGKTAAQITPPAENTDFLAQIQQLEAELKIFRDIHHHPSVELLQQNLEQSIAEKQILIEKNTQYLNDIQQQAQQINKMHEDLTNIKSHSSNEQEQLIADLQQQAMLQLESFNTKQIQLEAQIKQLKGNASEEFMLLQQQLQSSKTDFQVLQMEVQKLVTENAMQKAKIDEIEGEKLKNAEIQLQNEQKVQNYTEMFNDLTKEQNELKDLLSTQKTEFEQINTQKDVEIDQHLQEKQKLTEQIVNLTQQILNLNQSFNQCNVEVEKVLNEFKQYKEENNASYEEMNRNFTLIDQEIAKFQELLNELDRPIIEENAELKAQNDDLLQKLKQKQQELREALNNIVNLKRR